MDDAAREALAQRLSGMKFRKAIREMKNLDRDANMVFYQNSIWDEYQTLFLLPNEGIQITLVERGLVSPSNHEIGGGPSGYKASNKVFEYVEARVEPLDRPAHKRGGSGPSAMKQAVERS